MGAEVFDGSLQFTAGIDLSETDKIIADLEKQLLGAINRTAEVNAGLEKTASQIATTFNPDSVKDFGGVAESAVKSISRAVELLSDSFGNEKLEGLDTKLLSAKNKAEEFSTVLSFVKENIADINLAPESASMIIENINQIQGAMEGTTQEVAQFDEKFASSSITVNKLQNELLVWEGTLGHLFDEIKNTSDKNILDKLNAQAAEVGNKIDNLRTKISSLNDADFGKTGSAPPLINLEAATKNDLKQNLQELTVYASKLKEKLRLTDDESGISKINGELANTSARIATINAKLEETQQKTVRASAQLELLRNELATMSPNDAGYQEKLDQAVELENRLKNVNRNVALLGSNTAGVDALKQGINGLVGGFSAVVSSIALVTGDNDKLQQTMVKLFAVLQIVGGAEQFLATINKNSAVSQLLLAQYRKLTAVNTAEMTVATEGAAGAEVANAAATEGATAATLSLNAAIAANPIGALLITVIAAVGAIALFVSSTDNAVEAQTKLNESIAAANDLLVQYAQLQNREGDDAIKNAENAVSLAQSQGKSQREILELRKQANAVASQEAYRRQGFIAMDQVDVDIMERQLILINRQKNVIESLPEAARTKEQKQQLENLQAQEKSLKGIYDYSLGIVNAVKESNQKQKELDAEQARLNRVNSFKSGTAEAEARVAAAKKGSEAEIKYQKIAINARRQQELSNVDLTQGEIDKINADADRALRDLDRQNNQRKLDEQVSLAKASLALAKDGSIQEFNAKVSLINLESKKQLDQEGVTSAKVQEIQAEKYKSIEELNRRYNFSIAETEISQAIAGVNGRLAVVQKGSAEEFDLQKELLDQKEALEIAKAQSQINNEQKIAIQINEIHSRSLVDRKKLDDQYADKVLKSWLDKIQSDADLQNKQFEKILQNPGANFNDKFAAQQSILANNKKALEDMIVLVKQFSASGSGDVNSLNKLLDTLRKRLEDVNNEAENSKIQHFLDLIGKVAEAFSNSSGALRSFAGDLKGLNDGMSDTLETAADLIDGLSGVIQVAGALGSVAGGKKTTSQAGSGLATVGGLVGTGAAIGGALTAWSGPGAIIGAAIGAVVGAVAALLKGGKKVRESLQQTYEAIYSFQITQELGEFRINTLLRQRNLLKAQEIELTLKNLKAQQDVLNVSQQQNKQDQDKVFAQLQNESFITGVDSQKFGGFLGLWRKSRAVNQYQSLMGMTIDQIEKLYQSGQLDGKAKALFEQLQQLQQEGQDIATQLANLKEQAKEVFTGTTADSITDSIVDGFKNGEFAVRDFADNFEDLMRGAALNALKYQYLQEPLQAFYDQFAAASESDGTLTAGEISDLQKMYDEIIKNAGEKFKELQDITQLDFAGGNDNQNSLKGGIKAMTEQTAEVIAGQFGELRISMIQQVQICTQQLNVLNAIKVDTGNLSDIRADIRSLKTLGIKIIK